MQIIPRKYFTYLLIAVLFEAFVFTVIVLMIRKYQSPPSFISANSLPFWTIGGIALSLYAISLPWRRQNRFLSLASKPGKISTLQIRGLFILFGYIPCVTPLFYGLVLAIWRLSIAQYCYFVAISVAGTLAWTIYNLRKG